MKSLPTIKTLVITFILILFVGFKANASTYNPNNVTEPSGLTVNDIYNILEDTNYHYADTAQTFYNVEKKYGINAYFMISLTKIESNRGYSKLAVTKNNITSWRTKNGWRTFKDVNECIEKTAEMLYKSYIRQDGIYYNGLSTKDINKKYCEENYWHDLIDKVAFQDMKKVRV